MASGELGSLGFSKITALPVMAYSHIRVSVVFRIPPPNGSR
jgi:hypothetical protein